MAKFATAYIEIRADLSNFGKGLEKEVEARLRGSNVDQDVDRSLTPKFRGVGKSLADAVSNQTDESIRETIQRATTALNEIPKTSRANVDVQIRQAEAEIARLRADLLNLDHQTATPEVKVETERAKVAIDDVKLRLARLRAEKAEIKVDVDRSLLNNLSGTVGALSQGFRGIAVSVGGLLGIGGALTGLADAAAAALPVVAALGVGILVLVSSFAAAAAGAGALGIALAGALGPAAIVAFTALAKIAQVIKAIHDDSTKSAASANAVANAQDAVTSASEGLAAAQQNLRTQTDAAYAAWRANLQAVRTDILDVESAQEGIEQASINLREAQLALKKFKAEAPGLDNVFKKFTDVNVDLSGLKGALAEARKASGGKLSEDDSLKLEQLILNVRKAKTGEKEATDRLHQANLKLQQDRAVEAKGIQAFIRSYPGLVSATRAVTQARRSLASAERANAAALKDSASAVSKLSPIEQKLAATFKLISGAFNKALGPALTALFTGVNRGLRGFLTVLGDPKIVHALRAVGAALGAAFLNFSKFAQTKGARDSFVALARGSAQLIKIIGSRAFVSFAKILTAIAKAAMPDLVRLFGDIADVLDRWAKWIDKHPGEFRQKIRNLIGETRNWLGAIVDIAGFLIKLGGFFRNVGRSIGDAFDGGKRIIGDFFGQLHLGDETTKNLHDAFKVLGDIVTYLWKVSLPPLKSVIGDIGDAVGGTVDLIAGILHGDFKEAWNGALRLVKGVAKGILDAFRLMLAPFKIVADKIGNALSSPFRAAKRVIIGIINSLIGVLDDMIDGVNKILRPRDLGPLGHTPGIKIPKIPKIHTGGAKPTTGDTSLRSPNQGQGLPRLAKHPASLGGSKNSADASVTKVIDVGGVNISAPEAKVPDPQSAALKFARLVDSYG